MWPLSFWQVNPHMVPIDLLPAAHSLSSLLPLCMSWPQTQQRSWDVARQATMSAFEFEQPPLPVSLDTTISPLERPSEQNWGLHPIMSQHSSATLHSTLLRALSSANMSGLRSGPFYTWAFRWGCSPGRQLECSFVRNPKAENSTNSTRLLSYLFIIHSFIYSCIDFFNFLSILCGFQIMHLDPIHLLFLHIRPLPLQLLPNKIQEKREKKEKFHQRSCRVTQWVTQHTL